MANIKELAERLSKDQKQKDWETFSKELKKSNIKYYKIFYEKGKLQKLEDLRESYAQLYDSKEKPVICVPIFMKEGKKLSGATIYLKGLLNTNK